jgi:hypothetical protein
MPVAVAGGTVIACRYRLLSRLNSGGMGVIWRAEDTSLGVPIAAKQVKLDPDASLEDRRRALEYARKEARHAVALRSHPNVVTVHDVAEHDDGTPWMIMDLVAGRSLADILRTSGPVDVPTARKVAVSILSALSAAHAQGIVHRDLKPSNVMIDDDGHVLLTDFGIAKHSSDTLMTVSGALAGTAPYMAPERFDGVTSPACDLFALGATLYQALEGGQSPFHRDTLMSVVKAVGTFDPPPPAHAGALAAPIMRLLEKDPAARSTAAEALAAFEAPVASEVPGASEERRVVLRAASRDVRGVRVPRCDSPASGRTAVAVPAARLAGLRRFETDRDGRPRTAAGRRRPAPGRANPAPPQRRRPPNSTCRTSGGSIHPLRIYARMRLLGSVRGDRPFRVWFGESRFIAANADKCSTCTTGTTCCAQPSAGPGRAPAARTG